MNIPIPELIVPEILIDENVIPNNNIHSSQINEEYKDTAVIESDNESEKSNESPESPEHDPDRMEKFILFFKIKELKLIGAIPKDYVIPDDIDTAKSDYEKFTKAYEEKQEADSNNEKRRGIAKMRGILHGGCYLIEMLNRQYNPFDINIEDLASAVSSNDEINVLLGDIYEKHKKHFENLDLNTFTPEARLLITIATKTLETHITNTLIENMSVGPKQRKHEDFDCTHHCEHHCDQCPHNVSQQLSVYQNLSLYISKIVNYLRSIPLYQGIIYYLVILMIGVRNLFPTLF